MKVAIVGGTGSFGRALAKRLVDAGDEVVIGSRDADARTETAAPLGADGRGERGRGPRRRPRRARGQGGGGARHRPRAAARDRLDAGPLRRRRARFATGGVRPTTEATSLAERIQAELDAPGRRRPALARRLEPRRGRAGRGRARLRRRRRPAKELALELAAGLVAGRALDAGPLASARALEGMTAVIVNLNKRYKAHAGLRVTGLGDRAAGHPARGPAGDRGGRRPRRAPRRCRRACRRLEDGDVVVVAQKVVSKAEGRVVALDEIEPSDAGARARRRRRPAPGRGDPARDACGSSASRPPLVIAETRHGFVCASAGVDASNAPGAGTRRPAPARPRRLGRAHPRRPARADRPRRRRDRQRLVRPPVAPGDDRRRDRRRRDAAAARPARLARPGRLRAAVDADRRRRRARRRGRARDGQVGRHPGRGRARRRR